MPGNMNSTRRSPLRSARKSNSARRDKQERSHVHTDRDIAIGIHRGAAGCCAWSEHLRAPGVRGAEQ